jgi:hypothetical protein
MHRIRIKACFCQLVLKRHNSEQQNRDSFFALKKVKKRSEKLIQNIS